MNPDAYEPKAEVRCRLLDGTIALYRRAVSQEFMDSNPDYQPPGGGRYLGQGTVYSFNNVLQRGERISHFWA